MKRRKHLYPGTKEAEQEKIRAAHRPRRFDICDEEPDWTPSGKPNYEKFEKYGWDTEKVLIYLNID